MGSHLWSWTSTEFVFLVQEWNSVIALEKSSVSMVTFGNWQTVLSSERPGSVEEV